MTLPLRQLLVREQLPDVTVIQVPEATYEYPEYLLGQVFLILIFLPVVRISKRPRYISSNFNERIPKIISVLLMITLLHWRSCYPSMKMTPGFYNEQPSLLKRQISSI